MVDLLANDSSAEDRRESAAGLACDGGLRGPDRRQARDVCCWPCNIRQMWPSKIVHLERARIGCGGGPGGLVKFA